MLSPKPVDNFVGKGSFCCINPPHPFIFNGLHKKCAVKFIYINQCVKYKIKGLQRKWSVKNILHTVFVDSLR
jgi:hypothetical protein